MITKFIDEKFPKWAKVLLCIFGMAFCVYRILLFVDDCVAKSAKKNVKALVAGIVCLVIAPVGFVLSLIELFFIVPKNQFSNILR